MGRKKLNLNTVIQTDGKLRPEEDNNTSTANSKHEITSLDQLFYGDSVGFSKYKTMDLEEYKSQLLDMNTAELRRHAVEVAHVVPAPNRERLEKRLVLEFQKHINAFTVPKVTHKKEKEPSKEVLKIMSECK